MCPVLSKHCDPGGHCMHTSWPVEGWYSPSLQTVGAVRPVVGHLLPRKNLHLLTLYICEALSCFMGRHL